MERGSNIQRGSRQESEELGRNLPSTSRDGQQRTIPRNPSNFRRSEEKKRQGNNEARGTRRKFPMGFKALQNLLEEVRDIEEVILELANERSGFSLLLDSDLKDKPDIIVLITRILNRICDESDKCHLLKNIFVKGKFLKTLKIYISGLEFQNSEEMKNNSYFWNCSEKFWNNLINICKHLNQQFPSIGCEVTPELLNIMQTMIERLEQKHHSSVSDEIKTSITSLLTVAEKITKFQKERVINRKHIKYVPPTNNFRYMNIYPRTSEITNPNRSFYLNVNRIEGKYESVDEYLDVQFRLLREDFVTPLRKGICLYLEGSTEKNHEVRIYPRVQFLNSEMINELYCYRVQCEFHKKKRFLKYEDSKEFMFGSLMCFTRDNFNTVFFGRICKRDVKDLKIGQIIVGFEADHELIALNTNYLMVECKVYFEPYFHVLKVLQRFPINKFPMKKYIIDVEQEIDPPLYMSKNISLLNKIKNIKIFRGLNDSQSSAFKAALTKEFVVIQGPPGTGKTFVGLKIVRTLLQYREVWYNRSPILIICATNHALDQFLEGIANYTNRIVRIGGQSKNEKIAKFNIASKARIRNENGKLRSRAIYEARDNVEHCLYELESVNNFLDKINKRDCVFDFKVLRDVIPNYEKTWFFNASKMEIVEWLLAGKEENMEETPFNAEEQLNTNTKSEDNNENSDEENDDISGYPQIISLKTIKNYINYLMKELDNVRENCYITEDEKLATIQDLYYEIGSARSDFKYLKNQLEESSVNNINYFNFNHFAYIQLLNNPNVIAPDTRWKLYFYWLNRISLRLFEKIDNWSERYRLSCLCYNYLRSMEDSQVIKDDLVVGMTTTGAARMHSTLQTIASPIVIVEEAAEVLEAHIISALTVNCQHLILIGDHQQLKPNTADYNIETNFNLGVSLFERMVQNKIECHTLNVQHRMRPEISALIAPTIYPTLQNHDSVCGRNQINGVEKSLYFIDHQEPEQICNNESKKNPHEAAFILALAKHLILNGYKAEQITILVAYLGQMFEMNEVRKKYQLLEDVRIAVLDNYQGEENKIILLSLVRSNHENSIGFLKIENRVCVALSRARDGLYIIGNMNLLCANSKIWSEIKKTLVKQDAIGPKLPLVCQLHQNTRTLVGCEEDFLKVPEGGCDVKCGELLTCGHVCPKQCHVIDKEHVAYNCLEKCTKFCDKDPDHKCREFCYQECGPCTYRVRLLLKCGHEAAVPCHTDLEKYNCLEPVNTTLKCGHEVAVPCHVDLEKYNCLEPVETTLKCGHVINKPCSEEAETFECTEMCKQTMEPCGHTCTKPCHFFIDPGHQQYKCMEMCTKYRIGCSLQEEKKHRCPERCFQKCPPCLLNMYKKRPGCSHMLKVPCNADMDKFVCRKPCPKVLECGHKCQGKCSESCPPCKIMVDKLVPDCQHMVKVHCSQTADRQFCIGKCPRKLPCGHGCTKPCYEPCTTDCPVIVDCQIKAQCGHIITKIQCHLKMSDSSSDPNISKYCSEPCRTKLQCGHMCSGSCSECYQGRVHKKCDEKCGALLICNHECLFACSEACKPCQKHCEYKCVHSKCGKECGEPCTKCKQPCSRRCKHQECTKWCGDICDVDACLEPCENLLPCGHECIGFCGDSCPKLCRICNKDELMKIFDDEGARFVQLDECGHVFENSQLDEWFSQTNDKVVVKICPKCKTPVTKTFRYSHYLKQMREDLDNIKKELYGYDEDNEIQRTKLIKQLRILNNRSLKPTHLVSASNVNETKLSTLITDLTYRLLGYIRSRNNIELDAILTKAQILEHLVEVYVDTEQLYVKLRDQIDFIADILLKESDRLSNQEIHDCELEILRLQRIVQFENIINSKQYKHVTDDCATLVEAIEKKIYSTSAYSETVNNDVSNDLKQLNRLVSSSVIITDTEKQEIVQVVGFKLGHWCKCPKGHLYTDCDESKCSECETTEEEDDSMESDY